MDRSGSLELRKLFAKYVEGESAAGNVAGCIVMPDKSIRGEFTEKLLKNEKKTILKYYTLFKKVLGNNNENISFTEQDKEKDGRQFLLDKINATKLENKDINRILYERIAQGLPERAYAILLMQYRYDVPIKDKNKERQKDDYGGDGVYGNESSEVYTFMLAAVCLVSTNKESLGYNENEDKIGEMPQLMTLSAPEFGFLFPNFSDRSADVDSVNCYRTAKLDLTGSLFGQALPEIVKPEKKAKKEKAEEPKEEPGSETFDADTRAISNVSRTDKVPSMDSGFTAPVAQDDDDYTDNGDYSSQEPSGKASAGDEGMTESEVKAALNMPRVGDRPVKITGDKNKVEKRIIGGKQYWVIAVEDAYVD